MLTSAAIAFVTTWLAILVLRPTSQRIGLVDVPNARKLHVGAVPLVGGIAVSFGVLMATLFGLIPQNPMISILLLGGVGMVIMGAIDDAKDISPWLRLFFQALLIALVCYYGNTTLHNFGNLFNFGNIKIPTAIAWPVTILAVCAAINAYNMMDGIDGLAGCMAAISLAALGYTLYSVEPDLSRLCWVIVIALIPYLMVNLTIPPFSRKIFLGDAGSMFLGFIIGVLVLYGSQQSNGHNAFNPITALWFIGLPLMDMLGIMVRRIRKGQSPLRADRNHLHHILLHAGLSPKQSLLLMVLINVLIVTCGILLESSGAPQWLMVTLYLVLFMTYSLCLAYACKLVRVNDI
ncbi:undecaprenyl-phosphate alpha-N-acetylglucosaminyl 1-phosphate transferase [Plesiomonas shigelloides]|uniref:undecaprenyl-phosphate alpha-N-acetylglucosaminyl 1-phosphate transferase n=1 Tax=Plesiomonas shigelloides TaxID=703 RepID=UPI001261A10C|nr:undecaprenyl-phosphate alpha-N-acetylglucosaminyl 1-phosphate transferase [Plesiomonas shigelloides]KAB7697396.1 undecaprenyl-phosphate alpha-N-acetylglucosaminyl 1-phosphate transferase [Plesiomonas shigelloides]